ncbi:MAG: hypothetical protein ACRDH2_10320, partial [Anaerolineales bacterium]
PRLNSSTIPGTSARGCSFRKFCTIDAKGATMTQQLRRFTINRGKLDDFVRAWRVSVYPLRLKHGFTIEAAWMIQERNEFIWVLSYDGPEGFAARDAAYYASTERATLDPDPAQYIARAEQWFITPIPLDT